MHQTIDTCTPAQQKQTTRTTAIDSLPTPPEDACSLLLPEIMERRERRDSCYYPPSCEYPYMSLDEKVREANQALVCSWGEYLVGKTMRELCDPANSLSLRQLRLVSAIDLPGNFCIAPQDELLCPSDDPSRVIVIVAECGLILDVGVFDSSGAFFYKGSVDNHKYVSVDGQ
ncbi:hypothetical protein GQ54DRAFT_22528 [Martensiomyces pterosporus]|nr:hypothetical protein GQ54DRAFT_22528 [Martensiomyces pterosporus]